MNTKCPYCNKSNCVPSVVMTNVENYGNNSFNVNCNHCGKVISVYVVRIVKVISIEKTDEKEVDFPSWGKIK